MRHESATLHDGAATKSLGDLVSINNPMSQQPALKAGDTAPAETAIHVFLAALLLEKDFISAARTSRHGLPYCQICFATHAGYAMMDTWHGIADGKGHRQSIGRDDLNSPDDLEHVHARALSAGNALTEKVKRRQFR